MDRAYAALRISRMHGEIFANGVAIVSLAGRSRVVVFLLFFQTRNLLVILETIINGDRFAFVDLSLRVTRVGGRSRITGRQFLTKIKAALETQSIVRSVPLIFEL